MPTFAYVILHYKNLKDTLECIASIPKNGNSHIIVVDNNSLSKVEEKELKAKAKNVILLNKNYGFAKANNIGIRYAKEHYNPDFTVVINNDIIIEQSDFEKRITNIYKRTSFDALGPMIKTNGGNSVNPFPVYKNLEEISKAIKKTERNISLFSSKIKSKLFFVYHKLKYKIVKPKLLSNGENEEFGIALHGCAIIFSQKYINRFNDAFYNETFLYHEEEFLYYRMKKENLVFCYNPTISCFHKEGSSLDASFQKKYAQKELFRNKEELKSLKTLYDVLANDKKI